LINHTCCLIPLFLGRPYFITNGSPTILSSGV
jgi:hypothetical protein